MEYNINSAATVVTMCNGLADPGNTKIYIVTEQRNCLFFEEFVIYSFHSGIHSPL